MRINAGDKLTHSKNASESRLCDKWKAGISEEHELHSLKENAGRIPAGVGLQLGELLIVVVVTQCRRPTLAHMRRVGGGKSADEPFDER